MEGRLERKIDKKKGRDQEGKTERKKEKEDPISERFHITSCSPVTTAYSGAQDYSYFERLVL